MTAFVVFIAAGFAGCTLYALAYAVNFRGWRTKSVRRTMRRPPFTWLFSPRAAESPDAVQACERFAHVVAWIAVAVGAFCFVNMTVWIANGV
jgi:hypothetical protein